MSASGSPTISGVAIHTDQSVVPCSVSAGRVASTVPIRYAPPSPRYMRAGGALKTRNAPSAPASASPTISASPPRIANAAALTRHAPAASPSWPSSRFTAFSRTTTSTAVATFTRAGPGTTTAATTPISDLGAEPGPRGQAAGVVDDAERERGTVREQQREPVRFDRPDEQAEEHRDAAEVRDR